MNSCWTRKQNWPRMFGVVWGSETIFQFSCHLVFGQLSSLSQKHGSKNCMPYKSQILYFSCDSDFLLLLKYSKHRPHLKTFTFMSSTVPVWLLLPGSLLLSRSQFIYYPCWGLLNCPVYYVSAFSLHYHHMYFVLRIHF